MLSSHCRYEQTVHSAVRQMNSGRYAHTPVLLHEVIENLGIKPGGFYVDCTFGRGGHSKAIMEHLDQNGRLLAIDKDPHAFRNVDESLISDPRFGIRHGSYTHLQQYVSEYYALHSASGVLFDLGVSSPQLDDPQRGFSFQSDGALDMRMDNSTGITAAEWLMQARESEIEKVLRDYGEERFARRIARAIIEYRSGNRITSTQQLAGIVSAAIPFREKHKHPATRTFQALRIYLNRELEELQQALQQTLDVLATGGRLLVISFHSLEDRIVKRFMREKARGDNLPPDVPVTGSQLKPQLKIAGKPIYPGEDEVRKNPRSRSAVLRVAERLAP